MHDTAHKTVLRMRKDGYKRNIQSASEKKNQI